MARFADLGDLAAALPRLAASGADVVAYLERPGVLGDALRAQLAPARPVLPRLPADARRRLARRLTGPDRVALSLAPAARASERPPDGDFDLALAFRASLVDEVLAGLHETHAIPHALPAGALAPWLGEDAAAVRIPAPIRLALGAPGAAAVIPVAIERAGSGEAAGELRVPIAFDARAGADERIRIAIDWAEPHGAPIELELGGERRALADEPALRAVLEAALGGAADRSICPAFAVPGIDHAATLRLQRASFRGFAGEADGALAIGLVVGEETMPPGRGDPAALRDPFAGPLAAAPVNAWARAGAGLADKLVRAAWRTGALERHLDRALDEVLLGLSAEVHDASAALDDGAIRVRAELTLRGFADRPIRLAYAVEARIAIDGGGVARVARSGVVEEAGDPALLWSLAGGLLHALPAVGRALLAPLSGAAGPDEPPLVISSQLRSALPVPGTELVPAASVSHAAVEPAAVDSAGMVLLERDDTNLYVYALFADPAGPLRDATVLLRDLDRPAPPGDDVVPPEDFFHERVTATTFTTVRRSYRPGPDQTLKHGTTNVEGRVRFVLTPEEQHTVAGTVETTTVTEYLESERPPETTIQRQQVMERYPDLYFVVRRRDGSVVSTSARPIVNARRGEAGTAADPLRYEFEPPA